MNISRCLLIHIKRGISVGKQGVFILDGDHIFLNHDAVIRPAIDFDITGTEIDTKRIVCQNDNPFLLKVSHFLKTKIFSVSDNNMVNQRNFNQFGSFFYPFGDRNVLSARRRIAARMIV